MKYELAGVKNGVELYNPVPENEYEEYQIKINKERFCDFLAEMILKYWDKFEKNEDD